jgi:hypothetical protein
VKFHPCFVPSYFFLLRRYNFKEVLAFSTNSFHLGRFLMQSFQLVILMFATSLLHHPPTCIWVFPLICSFLLQLKKIQYRGWSQKECECEFCKNHRSKKYTLLRGCKYISVCTIHIYCLIYVKFGVRNLQMMLFIYEICKNRHISYGHKWHCIYVFTLKRHNTLKVENALVKFVHYGTEYILRNLIIVFIVCQCQ